MRIEGGRSGIKLGSIMENDFKHNLFYILRIFKWRSKMG